jgi:hypothetical protein
MATSSAPPQAYTRETLAQAYIWLKSQPESIKDRAKNADALVSLYLHACRHGLDVFKEVSPTATDAPRSTENFRNTLKDLSEGFRQFDEPAETPAKVSHLNVASSRPTSISHQAPPPISAEANIRPHPETNSLHANRSFPQDRAASGSPQQRGPLAHQASHSSDEEIMSQQQQVRVHQQQGPTQTPQQPRDPFPAYRAYLQDDEWARQTGHSVSLDPPFPPFANPASELTVDSRSHEILRRVRRKMNLSSENEALRMLISLGFERLRDIVP